MPSPSKEENILKLILETSPFKEWHFEELVKQSNTSKAITNKWLKKYLDEGLLKKIIKKNKYPIYTVGEKNITYLYKKKLYALEQLHKSKLLETLHNLKESKTIILFGSIINGDWYKNSDIDIFILGNPSEFNKKVFEDKLQREIELHIFENKKEIKEIKTTLIKNIINGYVIKGRIQDIANIST